MNTIEKAIERLKRGSSIKQSTNVEGVTTKVNSGSSIMSSKTNLNINFDKLCEAGYLTPDQSNQVLTDEYRVIKRPLLKNAFGRGVVPIANGNVIMVSSALPGEGKTFTSFNLAISMALEKDTTVLLVDSDLTKPGLSKLLNIHKLPGLGDYLVDGNVNLSNVILRTNLKRLSVLPAGKCGEDTTEMLASQKLKDVIEELASRYSDRIVIFDLPPIMVTTHAEVMLENAGQSVLVIEEGKTQQHIVKAAVSKMKEDSVVGLLLNKCATTHKSTYYGSYGTYGN